MAEKNSSFGEIKKAIIGVVTLAITTAGGLFIANMESFIKPEKEKKEIVVPVPQTSKDTIIVIQQQKKKAQDVANPKPSDNKKDIVW